MTVLRAMLLNPVVVFVSAAIGVSVCHALGADPHLREMAVAAGICLVSSELAALPVLFNASLLRAHISQAAMLGTVVHLLLATTMAAVVFLWLGPPIAFLYWLLPMYWLTLAALCVVFVRIMRHTSSPGPNV